VSRLDAAARSRILSRVGEYYESTLARHGASPRGVDWSSAASQQLRFAQLVRLLDPPALGSVNDYGCGYGALLDHLRQAGFRGRYCGFDVAPPMVASARSLHATDESCSFVEDESVLEPADYTFCSGVLNVKLDLPAGQWDLHLLDTLDRLRALSRRGFAFNALSDSAEPARKRPDLYYADPLALFDHCRRGYSRQVALLHDYELWEFTIVVRLEGGS
jgi:SAM-dependent methyltransferase